MVKCPSAGGYGRLAGMARQEAMAGRQGMGGMRHSGMAPGRFLGAPGVSAGQPTFIKNFDNQIFKKGAFYAPLFVLASRVADTM